MNSATIRPLGFGCGNVKWIVSSSGRNLDALDLFQFLDPALHLLGLGRLRAEAVDERLQLLDALPLIAIRRLELRLPLRLLRQIFVVVPAVEMHPLVPDLDRLAHRHIQKIPVVRNQNERVRIARQIRLQPVARLQVQMVGRLVQQQQVAAFRAAASPARSASASRPRTPPSAASSLPKETPAREHRPHLRLQRIPVARPELALDRVKPVRHLRILSARRIEIGHAVRQRLHLLLHLAQAVEHRHALGEHAPSGQRQPILRQIPRRDPLRPVNRPVVERFHPAQDLEQRRFARPVAPTNPQRSCGVISQSTFSNRILGP